METQPSGSGQYNEMKNPEKNSSSDTNCKKNKIE
jgi:hypothetical protein